jgi:hypothetical protein
MAKAVLSDKNKLNTVYLKNTYFSTSKIYQNQGSVKINQILPFRIKITNIGIEAYGPSNVPPIGIAVIGLNNYIL